MTNHIFETAVSLFDSILCIYFVLKFNNSSWKESKLSVPVIGLYFIVTLIGDFIDSDYSMLISCLLFVIIILYSLTVCGKRYIRAIITSCIYKVVYILLSALLFNIISLFSDSNILYASGTIGRYLYVVLHKIAMFAILSFIINIFGKDDYWERKNGIYTLIISIATLIGIGTAMLVSTTPEGNKFQTQLVIITVAFILINIIVYFLITQIQKLQKTKYELQLLQEKMKFEENRYKDISVIWENIRKVQHDIKQHLTVISCQLENSEIAQCKQYVGQLIPSINYTCKLVKTENDVLDYLINAKLGSLASTKVTIKGLITDFSDIQDSDLACLFGNIFDNAIEATAPLDDRRIELIFNLQNTNRVIICKNTIAESVLKHNKHLASSKPSRSGHGLGHKIIEKIVRKYEGIVDFFEEDGMFCVEIVLPIPYDYLNQRLGE